MAKRLPSFETTVSPQPVKPDLVTISLLPGACFPAFGDVTPSLSRPSRKFLFLAK